MGHRTERRRGRRALRAGRALAATVLCGSLPAACSPITSARASLGDAPTCRAPGTLSWVKLGPDTYRVDTHFRGPAAGCFYVAVNAFTINASGLTRSVGRCTQPSSPLNQTILVDLQGTIHVDGYELGNSFEIKPLAPSIFPGAPMIGSYAPGPNPGMRTEIVTRIAGNCPPAGTADAVLIFNGDNP